MNLIRLAAPLFFTFAFVSCATRRADHYDTTGPSAPVTSNQVNAPLKESANPVYDTPAAYEDSGTSAAIAAPGATSVAIPKVPVASSPKASPNGSAIIHTVVAGDTLSGISAKYKVPTAAIKQANGMTKDTVVLGKKMVIPPPH